MAHPLRLRMLSLLTGTAMSAAEVARELDITHANASYHLRILLESGEIVEAGEERIRGGVAKKYRYPHELRGHHQQARARRRGAGASTPRRSAASSAAGSTLRPRSKTRSVNSDIEAWVTPEVVEARRRSSWPRRRTCCTTRTSRRAHRGPCTSARRRGPSR